MMLTVYVDKHGVTQYAVATKRLDGVVLYDEVTGIPGITIEAWCLDNGCYLVRVYMHGRMVSEGVSETRYAVAGLASTLVERRIKRHS